MKTLFIVTLFVSTWASAVADDSGCVSGVYYTSAFRWANASERGLVPKRAVVRADIALSGGEKLLIYETGGTTPIDSERR
jgi:hypothetical protein